MASWLIGCVTRVRTIGTAKMEKRKQPRRGRKLEAFLWLDDRGPGPPIHTLSVRDGGWLAQFGGSRHGAGTYACMAMAQGLFEFIFPYGKETSKQSAGLARPLASSSSLLPATYVTLQPACYSWFIIPLGAEQADVAAASPSCLPPLIIRSTCSTTTSEDEPGTTWCCCFACGCGPMQDSERSSISHVMCSSSSSVRDLGII